MSTRRCCEKRAAPPGGGSLRRRRGSALLLVMITVGLMTLLVAGFAAESRREMAASARYRRGAVAYQLARAAYAAALSELTRQGATPVRDEPGDFFLVPGGVDRDAWVKEARRYRTGIPLGEGMYAYAIRDARERININRLTEAMWHRLLELACGIEEGAERTALVNAVQDWTDKDDLHRVGGAESDYYQTLDPPREAKNGYFDTVEELLLVKGFDRKILYGADAAEDPDGEAEPVEPIHDDLTAGGGLAQYLVASQALATNPTVSDDIRYILTGQLPEEDRTLPWEEGEVREANRPQQLRVIARGWVPGEDGARHAIVVDMRGHGQNFVVQQWDDNAVSGPRLTLWPEDRPAEAGGTSSTSGSASAYGTTIRNAR